MNDKDRLTQMVKALAIQESETKHLNLPYMDDSRMFQLWLTGSYDLRCVLMHKTTQVAELTLDGEQGSILSADTLHSEAHLPVGIAAKMVSLISSSLRNGGPRVRYPLVGRDCNRC